MAEKNERPMKRKNAFDNYKLRLQAKPLEGAKRSPTFGLEVLNNNPRFVVHYNDEKTESSYARMEVDAVLYFLEEFKSLCRSPENVGKMVKIKNKNLYKGDEKFDKPQVVNITVGGIDEDGSAWMGIAEEGKPPIRFIFEENWWYNVVDSENNSVDPSTFSRALAIAKCDHWLRLMASVSDTHYHDFSKDENRRPGNGGNQRRSRDTEIAPKPAGGEFDDIMKEFSV